MREISDFGLRIADLGPPNPQSAVRNPKSLAGLLVIDKPAGMTSHDVVQQIRKTLSTSRVGHLGTLDPMATGVLPLCTGKATRLAQFFPTSPKEYVGRIRFGFATATYDREGEPLGPPQRFSSTESQVAEAMRAMTGPILQTPPPYSAKKIGGIRSHQLARKGETAAIAPVEVGIEAFELTAFEPPSIAFRVVCSGGTYVRSLAHDLGSRLGCGAHLESLRRLRSGTFGIDQAVGPERVTAANVIPIESLLTELPRIVAPPAEEERVRNGNPMRAGMGSGLARIFNMNGELLAIAVLERGWAHPKVVLTS